MTEVPENQAFYDEYLAEDRLAGSVMTGGGPVGAAWTAYYRQGDTAPLGTPRAYGIIAFKKELIELGFGKLVNPALPTLGDATANRIGEFQRQAGLKPDEVIGPTTAKAMFKPRILDIEAEKGIPDNYLGKQTSLESGFDPGATGSVDPRDRGLNQINFGAHPDVVDAEAFDPAFSLNWSGDFLLGNRTRVGGDWDGALAAHNIGWFYAKKWVEAGKPASGLLTSAGKDYAVIATTYIKLLKSRVF